MNRRFAIDLEASGFFGFPIEIGWCEIGTAEVRSFLIRPDPAWDLDLWDPISQGIHGISLGMLMNDGYPARIVVDRFIRDVGLEPILFSDAISFDQRWLDLLFDAAGKSAPILRSAVIRDEDEKAVHRAGPDALALARRIALT